jgi:hypothetical protein
MSKVLTVEEIRDIIEEVAGNTTVLSEFVIVEGWSDHDAIEKATELTMEQVAEILTGDSDNWGFSDEYTTCSECGGLIKTSPDSYSWTPDFAIVNECELLCGDCIRTSPDSYLQDLINNATRANTVLNDEQLEEAGFKQITEEYEAGWYGRFDDPKQVLQHLEDKYDEVIFSISAQGQFATNFVCWVRSPKYNYPQYLEDADIDVFRTNIENRINELAVNLEEYDHQIILQTLVGSGAGSNAGKEFLELIGVDQYDINLAERQEYLQELVDDAMNNLTNDLMLLCEVNNIDLKNHTICVWYNETDGAIDVSLSINKDN